MDSIEIGTGRRAFLKGTAVAFAALMANGCASRAATVASTTSPGFGPLVPDPAGLLDLPEGFSYKVLSRLGDVMDDGFAVPDNGDGMGCLPLPGGKLALVRNHELRPGHETGGDIRKGFDYTANGVALPGGTTTLVVDAESLTLEKQYRSLAGTIRNCAGGVTPWGSWLTCEEAPMKAGKEFSKDHGWVFEVPATATGLIEPMPLKAMGRFNHEAACVDPRTGVVYMTEDRDDSAFYRFIPHIPGQLDKGGKLQALALDGHDPDTRNWNEVGATVGEWMKARWVDIENPESPEDDLRKQAAYKGAAIFARGEGLHMGDGELYFCCTSGGVKQLGQIFRLKPGQGKADELQLFFESQSEDQFNFGDNLCVGPAGHLVVCEDQYTDVVDNHLRWITPAGEAFALARLRLQTEMAGSCFSPDGKTLFVNVFSPTITLAIRGPWFG